MYEPSDWEASDLAEAFKKGELSRDDFAAFCAANNLRLDGDKQELYSAAWRFLCARLGRDIVLLKMPPWDMTDEVRVAYRSIIEFARRHKLAVNCRYDGRDIDLENPGEFPPYWDPAPAPQCNSEPTNKRRWFDWWRDK